MRVPDISAEIQRKVLDTLSVLRQDRTRGVITEECYAYAVSALNSATRGLIDHDLSQAMDDSPVPVVRFHTTLWRKGNDFIALNRVVGKSLVQTLRINLGTGEAKEAQMSFEDEQGDTEMNTEAYMRDILSRLSANGFETFHD